jgi:hypothetical protein
MLADGVAGARHGTGNDDFVIHDGLPLADRYGSALLALMAGTQSRFPSQHPSSSGQDFFI